MAGGPRAGTLGAMAGTTTTRTARSRMITLADGRRLHASTWSGRGTPLVLMHGLLDSAAGWTTLCESTRRPCVAIDLAGFGQSDLPAHPSFSSYADDIVAALRELAPRDMVLVGHSLGGAIATAVAERIPGRVKALILLGPAGFGRIPLAEAISIPGVRIVAERLMPFALGNRATISMAYRALVANGVDPADELLARLLDRRGTLVPGAVAATKAVVRGGLSARAFHRRRVGYDGPVVLLWGDRDRLVPISHMAGVVTAFPHVDARVWRGMGHHPQVERPALLARLVEATCARAEGGSAAVGADAA